MSSCGIVGTVVSHGERKRAFGMDYPQNDLDGSRHPWFFAGVFLTCMCGLMLQIRQTRALSVVVYYHLAFFAIGVAMLGMTDTMARVMMLFAWLVLGSRILLLNLALGAKFGYALVSIAGIQLLKLGAPRAEPSGSLAAQYSAPVREGYCLRMKYFWWLSRSISSGFSGLSAKNSSTALLQPGQGGSLYS